jgi:hypothetical protein
LGRSPLEVREGLAARFEGLPDVHYADAEHFVDVDRQTGIAKWLLSGLFRWEAFGGSTVRPLYVSRQSSDRKRLVLDC